MQELNIEEVLQFHAMWLQTSGAEGRRAVFRNKDLRMLDLAGKDLRRAIFSGANLERVNLKNSVLDFADFSFANLSYSNLEQASMKGCRADEVNLEGAKLNGSNLQGANLNRANFYAASCCGCKLANVKADFSSFINAKLDGADLVGGSLEGVDFTFSDLTEANFENANLIGADLRGANLIAASFRNCKAEGLLIDDPGLVAGDGDEIVSMDVDQIKKAIQLYKRGRSVHDISKSMKIKYAVLTSNLGDFFLETDARNAFKLHSGTRGLAEALALVGTSRDVALRDFADLERHEELIKFSNKKKKLKKLSYVLTGMFFFSLIMLVSGVIYREASFARMDYSTVWVLIWLLFGVLSLLLLLGSFFSSLGMMSSAKNPAPKEFEV